MSAPARLVPLPPSPEPDGLQERALDLMRRKLATEGMHPSRRRMLENELKELERAAA